MARSFSPEALKVAAILRRDPSATLSASFARALDTPAGQAAQRDVDAIRAQQLGVVAFLDALATPSAAQQWLVSDHVTQVLARARAEDAADAAAEAAELRAATDAVARRAEEPCHD